jgi:eukaryotic-like serine/threonine-protein kinase
MHCNGSCATYAAAPPSSERALEGRLLGGRYLVEHLIGAGAMGRVYRAWHVGLARACAVKVIRESACRSRAPSSASSRSRTERSPGVSPCSAPEGRCASRPAATRTKRTKRGRRGSSSAPSSEAVARFHVEARAASRLDHPNIVQLIDFGCEELECGGDAPATARGGSLWYLVTEHLDGEDLTDLLNAEPILPTARIVAIMRQLCAALQHAHDAGVVHRDVKPENIRLVPRMGDDGTMIEQAKLLDFGTAKLLWDDRSCALPSGFPLSELDEDGGPVVIGTPAYMSPEQAAGQRVDARSDLYACGVLLFEMATGRLPFERATPIALAAAHVECPPPAPSALNGAIDQRLEALILRCLRKSPDERPQSARALREALGRLAAPLGARRSRRPHRERFAPPSGRQAAAEEARTLVTSTWVGHCHRLSTRPPTPPIPTSPLALSPAPLAALRSSASAPTWVGHRASACLSGRTDAPLPELAACAAPPPDADRPVPPARSRRPVEPPSDGLRPAQRRRRASPALLAALAAAVLGGSVCVWLGAAGGPADRRSTPHGGRAGAALPTGDGGAHAAPEPALLLSAEPP